MYLNRYRRVILLVLVAIVVSATLAFSGLILGRHVVEVEPGPPVELDYNGSSLVVAAVYRLGEKKWAARQRYSA